MNRFDALSLIAEQYRDCPIVATCGATSRELKHIVDRDSHLYVVDSMGLSSSIAIGLCLGLQGQGAAKVVAIEGDGGMLMNPNALSSASFLRPANLVLIVLDNGCFASTGGQRAQTSRVPIANVAAGFGLTVFSVDDLEDLRRTLQDTYQTQEPVLLHVKITPDNVPGLPYVNDDPVVLADRFKRFLTRKR